LLKQYNNNDLIDFAGILSQLTDFHEVLKLVAHKSSQFLGADLSLILMVNPVTRDTVKTIIKNGKYSEEREYHVIHTNVGGWIINYQKSFLSKDIYKDKRFSKGLFINIPIKSVLGVPLIIEGLIIGTLILLYKNSSEYANSSALNFLESLATISTPFLRNVQKIRQYFDSTVPDISLLQKYKIMGLLGKGPKFIELLHAVEAAARCDVRVLLDGKTGTGKELIAKAIHKFSSRSDYPFIAIDCGAIPSNLIESELFGHKRGAFTGAQSERQGLFMEADGGTLFMDEINNLPYDMQSKLLRILQEGEIRSLGSDKSIKINVRIITASSSSLKKLVEDNKFREDLFYRLHVYPIHIPDLIERQEDIPLLANHFLHKYADKQNKKDVSFHEEIIDFMKQCSWNGNIRELENFVERLVTLTPKNASQILIESFPADLKEKFQQFLEKHSQFKTTKALKSQVQMFEAQIIKETLIACGWNKSETARRLKTSEKNIRYKMKQLNIEKEELL